jgi:hypothetical protein
MSGHHPWKDIPRKNDLTVVLRDIDKQHHVHDTKCSKVCQGKTKGIAPWDHQLKKVSVAVRDILQIIDLWGIDYQ